MTVTHTQINEHRRDPAGQQDRNPLSAEVTPQGSRTGPHSAEGLADQAVCLLSKTKHKNLGFVKLTCITDDHKAKIKNRKFFSYIGFFGFESREVILTVRKQGRILLHSLQAPPSASRSFSPLILTTASLGRESKARRGWPDVRGPGRTEP